MLYSPSQFDHLGSAGSSLPRAISQAGIAAQQVAWDLLSIALSVESADQCCTRQTSADGWTRQIDLEVAVQLPELWRPQTELLRRILQFLTGDIWHFEFVPGGFVTPNPTCSSSRSRTPPPIRQELSVCLLSGGADSLAGGIKLHHEGQYPLFVSQIAKGDKMKQREFTKRISGEGHHLQVSHNVRPAVASERSQRARSFFFIALGTLAATSLTVYPDRKVTLFIPENGFISMNVPLTPRRIGSLSTRTTHPYYLALIQNLFDAVGLRVTIQNPFRFLTKGEMFRMSPNDALLEELVSDSTSCGRFARFGFMHCGRCVPCLIRRAAFFTWGRQDRTKYKFEDLAKDDEDHRHFDDVKSILFAIEQSRLYGCARWIGAALNFPGRGARAPYEAVVQRGLSEVEAFLRNAGIR
ncbi:MAG: Qat anti-phage system QueC-like protein QatC [Verrucomicrobiota bacterium]